MLDNRPPCLIFLTLLLLSFLCLDAALEPEYAQASAWKERNRREQNRREKPQPAPPPLTPQSFASGMTLDGPAGAVLSLELTEAVYSRLWRSDFRDICVFDANGVPVPFTLYNPDEENTAYSLKVESLPFFPWQPGNDIGDTRREMRLPRTTDVEVDSKGGIIRIRTQDGGTAPEITPAPRRQGRRTLLLDMQPLLDAIAATHNDGSNSFGPRELRSCVLTFTPEGKEAFMVNVDLQASGDLSSWRNTSTRHVLARLLHGSDRVERLDVPLPQNCPRYLLLTLDGDALEIASISAQIRYSKLGIRQRENVIPGQRSEDGRSILYTLTGAYALTGLDFDLPQSEIMSVNLESRPNERAAWRSYRQFVIYRLDKGGGTLRNEPIDIPGGRVSERHWRLNATGAIPFVNAPGLRLYWTPHTLMFLARGQGPWTLAYGRSDEVEAPLLPLASLGEATAAKVLATPVTPPLTQPPAPEQSKDYSQWLLWGSLALAALFLSGIAVYLMRSMKT